MAEYATGIAIIIGYLAIGAACNAVSKKLGDNDGGVFMLLLIPVALLLMAVFLVGFPYVFGKEILEIVDGFG